MFTILAGEKKVSKKAAPTFVDPLSMMAAEAENGDGLDSPVGGGKDDWKQMEDLM